jgi:hypothetical protein
VFTKQHAEAIARKLKATISPRKAHDVAVIAVDGKRIAQFGIRRGSRNDQSHDHLASSLHLSPRDTMELARCSLSQEQWIATMKTKGFVSTR